MAQQIAVVTGAASGVGAAVARRLRDRGLAVVGVDLQADATEDSPDYAAVTGSVASAETWATARDLAADRWNGSPDVLVFAAAVLVPGTVLSLSEDDWRLQYEVNVDGVFHGARTFLPSMIERGRGSITTVASVDAYMVEQDAAGYVSSKGALLQLTKSIAIDYARDGIRANCVAPGVIDTPFFRRHLATAADPEQFVEVRRQRNPLGRFLDADEVARTVEFAALDASGMTGSVLTIDAGLSASFDFRADD